MQAQGNTTSQAIRPMDKRTYPVVIWHKYKAKRQHRGGYSFASKLEASVYDILCLMQKQGELRELFCQPHVFLTQARIEMIPDFRAIETETGEVAYFEAKGFETDVWRIKRKLWKFYGPGRLHVYKGDHRRPSLCETLTPRGIMEEKGEDDAT